MPELHQQISALEDRIAELSDRAERCRKVDMAAKAIMGAGLAWLALPMFGLVHFTPASWLIAIAASLGGVVLYGSNKSTLKTLLASIEEDQARRTELIDMLGPRAVQDEWAARRLAT